MFFFEVIVPIIVYSAVIGLTYVGTKFLIKGIKNRIAKRRVNKELKQESNQQKSFENQNQKAVLKNKKKPQDIIWRKVLIAFTLPKIIV